MLATIGEGDRALDALNKSYVFYLPNTMYCEGNPASPVIETPLSVPETMHYLILQCYDDVVKVFPTVPSTWTDITFAKLLAHGAFEISGKRESGINKYVHIESLKGCPLKIKPNIENAVHKFSNPK